MAHIYDIGTRAWQPDEKEGWVASEVTDKQIAGDKVTLVGFGSFESRERKAREGRNPKTGDKMEIPATRVPAFSAGKLFKDRVAPPKNAD